MTVAIVLGRHAKYQRDKAHLGLKKSGAPKGGVPRRVEEAPKGGGPKFVVFSSGEHFLIFFSSWIFGGVWKLPGRQMCMFGVLGFHTTAHPVFENTTKFHEKTPRETRKRAKMWSGEGKKREMLGSPPFVAPNFSVFSHVDLFQWPKD